MKWLRQRGSNEQAVLIEQRNRLGGGEQVEKIWERPLADAEYFIIDIETSGFSAQNDIVLSLATAYMPGVEQGLIPLQYDIVFHEDITQVPDAIWALTGLTPFKIQEGKPWRDVLFEALTASVDKVWIAHHARHELSFMQRHARSFWKIRLRPIIIDTAMIAQALGRLPEIPTLDFVCNWLDVKVQNRHCADADVLMTAEVWKKEVELCRSIGLQTVGDVIEWSISYAYE